MPLPVVDAVSRLAIPIAGGPCPRISLSHEALDAPARCATTELAIATAVTSLTGTDD